MLSYLFYQAEKSMQIFNSKKHISWPLKPQKSILHLCWLFTVLSMPALTNMVGCVQTNNSSQETVGWENPPGGCTRQVPGWPVGFRGKFGCVAWPGS